MSEMTERVARVIETFLVEYQGEAMNRSIAEWAAPAVIKAMREPTEAMVTAIYGRQGEFDGSSEPARAAWQSMIDAAM